MDAWGGRAEGVHPGGGNARTPLFLRRIFPSKTVPRRGEPDAEPFFCIFNGTLGKERERKAFPESQGSVFSGRCVPTES